MQFDDVKKEVKAADFYEIRLDNENFFEGVILKKNLDGLINRLNGIFGSPVWPSENELSTETKDVIKSFGGIMPGQTLYFCRQDNLSIFVMLWPWSDGIHITLKCGQK
jgi:hypothetical protein